MSLVVISCSTPNGRRDAPVTEAERLLKGRQEDRTEDVGERVTC
jgi:hypothetical protein